MKHLSLITPFLFTLAFVLFIYTYVITLVSPYQLFRLILVLWVFLGILIFPSFLITRSLEWTAILLTVFAFGFYFSQIFFEIVGSITLALVGSWIAYFHLRGLKIGMDQFFLLLNVIATTIIVLSLYQITQFFGQVPWLTYYESVKQARNYSIPGLSTPSLKPDVYYIILDGYPRSDILKNLYGYDNLKFDGYLQEKGFVIPSDVLSNYAKTGVSVPSTLNMDYIHAFAPGLEDSHFWWLMIPFYENGRVRAVLESQGYRTVYLSTLNLADTSTASVYNRPFPIILTTFERYMFQDTPLGIIQPVIKDVAFVPTYDAHRRVIAHFFSSLAGIPRIQGPKFIFAHITSPHPPFVFDRNGQPIDPPGKFNMNDANEFPGSRSEYRDGYIAQIEYLNVQMRLVLDAILEHSNTPPIIIIQADHGSGLLTDFSSAENTCIKERFAPFAAYHLPGVDPKDIPQDISAVNIFRIIFNHYFDADLPLLENRQYYHYGKIFLYRVVDVTSAVNKECVAH